MVWAAIIDNQVLDRISSIPKTWRHFKRVSGRFSSQTTGAEIFLFKQDGG